MSRESVAFVLHSLPAIKKRLCRLRCHLVHDRDLPGVKTSQFAHRPIVTRRAASISENQFSMSLGTLLSMEKILNLSDEHLRNNYVSFAFLCYSSTNTVQPLDSFRHTDELSE